MNEKSYLVGAPELVGEIAHSSRALDMNHKRRVYQEAGVQEYIVFCVEEEELHWFRFPSRRKLKPDRQGIFKSRVFPGLWLNGSGFVALDSKRLRTTLQEGMATAEHAAFIRKLSDTGE